MWGAIIGAAAGVAGSLIGGHNAAKERRRQLAEIEADRRRLLARESRVTNQSANTDAATVYQNEKAKQAYEEGVKAAQARKAMGMAGDADVAAAQSAASTGMANQMAQNAANFQNYQRGVEGQTSAALTQNSVAKQNVYASQAKANADMASSVVKAGAGLAVADAMSEKDGNGVLGNMFGFNEHRKEEKKDGQG